MDNDANNLSPIVHDENDRQGEETPVCVRCFRPSDPLVHYCPHCGEATGMWTTYLPYENIRWYAGIYARMWNEVWSRDVSMPGRILRMIIIVMFAPIMLVGLIPKFWHNLKMNKNQHADEPGNCGNSSKG